VDKLWTEFVKALLYIFLSFLHEQVFLLLHL